ncbi:MAG: glycosyl hydrolase, partial [Candidatus Hydrogenedentales bacterium]
GYDLRPNLPSLYDETGDWKRVRHDYYATLLDLFIENWAKPYYDYCARNNLMFTGHYWEHEWPNAVSVPDNMAMGAWQHIPGIDILFNQYDEGVHAQFGNDRAVIELASVANQLGRKRRLCEAYGGGGWDLRFEDMKRIGDWISVLGVNFIDQHLAHSTLRGARKGDYPQTFSYHATWWDAYGVQAQYLTRVSYAMSQGEQINTVLVIEPTTTMWMYQEGDRNTLEAMGQDFQHYVTKLAKDNVEFDLGSEPILATWGSVENGKLVVGKRAYDLVVVPVRTENLNDATMTLIESYLAQGGKVLCEAENPPSRVDGQASDRIVKASQSKGWQKAPSATVLQDRQSAETSPFSIALDKKAETTLYHQRRTLDDGDLVFLVNTSATVPASGTFRSVMKGVEQWNLETGETGVAYPFEAKDGGVQAAFDVPPCGSLLLFLSKEARTPVAPKAAPVYTAAAPKGDLSVKRATSNVLTLDYVDLTVGGETREAQYYYASAELIFQKHGLDRNPWDSAVQFKDELISKTFAPDSGFEATYRFAIDGEVPQGLRAVVERPDLYAITCNGTAVTAIPGEWWTDRAWGVLDIAACVKTGENTLTIKAQPFTMFHELERAYILGEFSLKSTEKGFAIAKDSALGLGPWNVQGCPLYSAGVTYTQHFDIPKTDGRVEVALGDWLGSVAKVRVNGADAGYIYHQPYTCDIAKFVKAGDNTVEVEVIGTNKNTLGPHHGNPPLGIASPGMFRNGPAPGPPAGTAYSTIGYGLFSPFQVRSVNQ